MIPIIDEVTLVRPGVPFGKERPRARVVPMKTSAPKTIYTARMYTPKRTRDVENEIGHIALQRGIRLPDDSLAVTLDVVACWPWLKSHSMKKRRELVALYGALVPKITNPDPDNIAKLVADALEGIAYTTDGRVWLMRACTVFGEVAETHIRITYGGSQPFPAVWW